MLYAAFKVFQPVAMSFGLKIAPFCFSSLIDWVLEGLSEFALPYLDHGAVFSDDWPMHLGKIRQVVE